jgi:thiol-disulfide isomerase/thioredoxin
MAGCASETREAATGKGADVQLPPAVTVRTVDAAGLRAVLEKHQGDVVLVDFWATWCGPCLEQLPHTVALAEKWRERGLAVVTVSMDNPSSEAQVLEVLQKNGARTENLLNGYTSAVTATKEFGLPGPVPCYRVYDREGKLRREFYVNPRAEKQFTAADVEGAVEEVL